MIEQGTIMANGRQLPAPFPCTLHDFLIAQKVLPRSVVVEHNGEAVSPSNSLIASFSRGTAWRS